MKKIKYISVSELQKNLKKVLRDVYELKIEYIIMDKNQTKAKITPFNGKEILMEETDKKIDKFISKN